MITAPRRQQPLHRASQRRKAHGFGHGMQSWIDIMAISPAARPRPAQMASRETEKQRLRDERLEREREAERWTQRRPRLSIAATVVAGLIVVAGGVILAGRGGGDSAIRAGEAPASIADVHGIGVNPSDKALYIATHSGLFRSPPGAATATRVDAPEQDLMGFAVAGSDRFVASGHPGPGQRGPASLGLLESRDRGRSWRPVSLEGADLHLLRAAGDAVYAFDGQLRASRDGGRSWEQRKAPDGLIDLAIDPTDGDRVLASTEAGVQASRDGGRTWQKTSLSMPVLLAWARPGQPAAISGDGGIHASADGGRRWTSAGTAAGQPAAFAADRDGALYVARPDGAVDRSGDGGRTWRPRSRN